MKIGSSGVTLVFFMFCVMKAVGNRKNIYICKVTALVVESDSFDKQ